MAYKIEKTFSKETRENFQTNELREEEQVRHYQDLSYGKDAAEEKIDDVNTEGLDDITLEWADRIFKRS